MLLTLYTFILDIYLYLQGSFKVGINATSLFDDQFSPDDEYYEDILILPEISTMAISQSVSVSLFLKILLEISTMKVSQ